MVAIVSGDSLGLSLSSLATLGQEGSRGAAGTGRNGEQAFVNVATGNLVLQDQDDYVASHGTDITILRTYNSQGILTGGALDNWALGTTRQRVDWSAASNTITRTDRDSAQALYTGGPDVFVTTAGSGAHDKIERIVDGSFVWTDGATGLKEYYDSTGKLTSSTDTDGNQLTYAYGTGNRLESVTSASGEVVAYNYDANGRLSGITNLLNGATVSKVHYAYTGAGQLAEVIVDLDPLDPSKIYWTRYAYEKTQAGQETQRLSRVTQSDGTSLAFTYHEVAPGDFRVATVTDALLHITSYSYNLATRVTTVIDPVGLATQYHYGDEGELLSVQTGSVVGLPGSTSVSTTTVTVIQIAVSQGTDAQGRATLSWALPEVGTNATFRYRPQGGTAQDWVVIAPVTSGATQHVVLPIATAGVFEYELLQAEAGSNAPSGRALGTFTTQSVGVGHTEVTSVAVQAVAVQITGDTEAGTSCMTWTAPAAGITTTWRYRMANDAQAPWLSLASQTVGGSQSVGLSGLAAGSYEFTLVETSAQGQTVAHATGVVTVSALVTGATATTWPTTSVVAIGTNAAGQAQLSWAAPPAGTTTIASYRKASGIWQNLAVTLDAATGKQVAILSGIAAGTYEYKMEQSGAATLKATGRVQILPTVASHVESQQVPIDVLTVTSSSSGLTGPLAPSGSITTFRYRALGTTTWSTYTGPTSSTATTRTIPSSYLPLRSKWVEFELLHTPTGSTTPIAYAIGAYYYGGGSTPPTLKLGQVALAADGTAIVTGATPTTRAADVTIPAYVPAREATPVVVSGSSATGLPQLSWDIPPVGTTATLKYKDAGGTWRVLTLTSDAASGKQSASLAGIPAGNYEYELSQAGGFTARVTGTVQTFAQVPGGNVTQQLPIAIIAVTDGDALSWTAGVGGATTVLRYRLPGSSSWTTYSGSSTIVNGQKVIDAEDLPRDKLFEFEILETPAGGGTPTAHAVGLFYDHGDVTVTVQLGQVGLQNGTYTIVGPTPTTRAVTAYVAAHTPAPVLIGATLFTIPPFKPVPTATNTTSSTVQVSVWVPAPFGVTAFTQTATTTADVQTPYYTNAAGVQGLRQVRNFTYLRGDITQVSNGAGETTTFEYDTRGNLILQRDHAGNTVARTYNDANRVSSETTYMVPDPDGAGALPASNGVTAHFVYNPDNATQLRFEVSAQGRVTEHAYSLVHGERLSTLTYTVGTFAGNDYNALVTWAAARPISEITRSDMAYDIRGQLKTVTTYANLAADRSGTLDGLQSTAHYVYNPDGTLKSVIDPTGGKTEYTYDGLGRLLTTVDALQRTTYTQYDDAGNRTTVTLANGLATTSVYDRAGRLVAQVQSDTGPTTDVQLGTTRYAYDAANRLVMSTDPTDVRTFMLYDEQGRLVGEVDGDGTLTEYRYDAADRLSRTIRYATAVDRTRLVNSLGQALMPTLQAILPATSAERALDTSIWRTYDAAGRLAFTVDGEGAITKYCYDGASRLVETRQYFNSLASPAALGDRPRPQDITPVTDTARDRVTRNFYDSDGLLLATLDAEGYLQELHYDAAGRLIKKTAYSTATAAAQRVAGELGALRPVTTSNDAATIYLYNRKGELAGEIDATGGLTEYRRDLAGRQIGTTRYFTTVGTSGAPGLRVEDVRPPLNVLDRITSCAYNALGQRIEEVNEEGTRTTYQYDVQTGLLKASTVAAGTSNARTIALTYDVQGRLIGELSGEGYANNHGLTHTYDAAGRRTSTTDAAGSKTLFYYDLDGRLAHTVNARGEVTETHYDVLGNRDFEIRYGTRIATGALSGGLVNAALTSAIQAAANPSIDSTTRFGYSHTGELVSITDPLNVQTRIDRNAFGEEKQRTEKFGTALAVATTYVRDRRGLLTASVADVRGLNVSTTAVYDAFGRMVSSTDGNNVVRTQEYDRMGRVLRTFDAFNAKQSTEYDVFGRVVTQTDAFNKSTSYIYGAASGRAMTVTTPEGVKVKTIHNEFGQTIELIDARGSTTYEYDKDGNLTLQKRDSIQVALNTYDDAGRLEYQTDANGVKVKLVYDAVGRVLQRIVDDGGLGLVTRYEYDAMGRTLRVTDPNLGVTEFAYFQDGRLRQQTADLGGLNLVTQYEYDVSGHNTYVTSPGLTRTKYEFDALGRRTAEIADYDGLKLKRSYTYDANGNVRSAVDANGNRTRYVYDAENRLVFTVGPTGSVQQSEYDAQGRLTRSTVYANSVSLAQTEPTSANVVSAIAAAGASTSNLVENRVYDNDGRMTATVNALGEVVRYNYDSSGNVTERRAFANRLTGWQPGDNALPVAHADDQWVRTRYDTFNRAVYTLDSAGAVTTTGYDGNGNVVLRVGYANKLANPASVTLGVDGGPLPAANPSDAKQRNVYDGANRLTHQVDGTGAVRVFTYDKNGNLVDSISYSKVLVGSALTQALNPNSTLPLPLADPGHDAHVTMVYDKANRITASATALGLQGGVLMWALTAQSYDGNGNVLSRTSYAGAVSSQGLAAALAAPPVAVAADRSVRMIYDNANRLVYRLDAVKTLTRWTYDANGQVVQNTTYAEAWTGSFAKTTLDASALKATDRVSRTLYDAASRVKFEIDATGAVTEYTYDGAGNAVSVRQRAQTVAAGATPAGTSSDPADRVTRQVFDAAGRARFVTDALGFVKETVYDALGRIKKTIAGDRTTEFAYDPAGNVTSITDALGKTEFYAYDGLGRKTSFTNKLQATWVYVYDAAGRLLREASPPVVITTITFDPWGNPQTATQLVSQITQIVYDALGNVTSRIEAYGLPDRRITSYEYDAAGRQTATEFPLVTVYGSGTTKPRVEVTYDTFGNAVANRDVGGKYSYKIMDLAGQVAYEVDAAGYITGYKRNAFGEVTQLTRYAGKITATGTTPPLSQVLTTAGTNNPEDRKVTTEYDTLGRAVKVIEPEAYVYEPNSAINSGGSYFYAAKTTQKTYNVFGDLLKQSVYGQGAGTTTAAAETYFRYDALGRQVEQIVLASGNPGTNSGVGYLTRMEYDSVGNLTTKIEYAPSLTVANNQWNALTGMGYTPFASAVAGRVTHYAYDRNNNKESETLLGIVLGVGPDGAVAIGNAITTYAYDALGNLVKTLDPAGLATYTYRDALGRTTAVATVSEPKVRAQVAQIYLAILGRAPESAAIYEDRLGAKAVTPLEMALQVYTSPEAAVLRAGTVDDLITRVYQGLVGRDPDAGAIAYWKTQLAGTSDTARAKLVLDIIAGFGNGMGTDAVVMNSRVAAAVASPSANLLQATNDAKRRIEIAQLYAAVFGRAPDPTGLASHMVSGATRTDMANQFFSSPEGANLYATGGGSEHDHDLEIVSRLFQNIHGRAPTEAERQYWVGMLDKGRLLATPQTIGGFIVSMVDWLITKTSAQLDADAVAARALFLFDKKVGAGLVESSGANAGATPLTTFGLDIYGNAVLRTDYASGTLYATDKPDTSVPGKKLYDMTADAGQDRYSYSVYDSHGHVTRTVDADNKSVNLQYDAFGNLRKESRQLTTVTGAVPVSSTTEVSTLRSYDAAGRLLSVQDPSGILQELVYNAFGEVAATKIGGAAHEYFDYDNAGHLWRTNQGDGIDKIRLYDVFGRQTADIRSGTHDMKTYATAQGVVTELQLLRTETWYDLMGNAIKQVMPVQNAGDIGGASAPVSILPAFVSMKVVTRSMTGTNEVQLNWMSLAGLGSGDVKVELFSSVVSQDISGNIIPGTNPVRIFRADEALDGIKKFTWQGSQLGDSTQIRVSKMDASGQWVILIDQMAPVTYEGEPAAGLGAYGNLLRIDMPGDLANTVTLKYRLVGTSTWTDAVGVRNFGDMQVFDTSSLPEGNYEYQAIRQGVAGTATIGQGFFGAVQPMLRTEIAALYLALLKRVPESAGFVERLLAARSAGGSAALEAQKIFESPECRNALLSAYGQAPAFVAEFYKNATGQTLVLDDQGGMPPLARHWVERLTAEPLNKWGGVILDMVRDLISYTGTDPAWRGAQTAFNAKIDVGLKYAAAGGQDTVANLQNLATYAVSAPSTAAQVIDTVIQRRNIAELYVAILNRAPEPANLGNYLTNLGSVSLSQVAENFYNSPEAKSAQLYWGPGGVALSNADFVKQFYRVALGREVGTADLAKYTGELATSTRGTVLLKMIDDTVTYSGIDATMYAPRQLLNNKVAVALAYYEAGGTNNEAALQLIANVTAAPTAVAAAQAAIAAMKLAAPAATAVVAPTTVAMNALPLETLRKNVAQLYVAMYNRAPDASGMETWVTLHKTHPAIDVVNSLYYDEDEGLALRNASNATFVTTVCTYVFGSAPSADELNAWVAKLSGTSRNQLVLDIIDSVVSYTGTDSTLKARQNLFNNKTAVGLAYAVDMGGGGDLQLARTLMAQVTPTDIGIAMSYAFTAIKNASLVAPTATLATVTTAHTKSVADVEAAYKAHLAAVAAAAAADAAAVASAAASAANAAASTAASAASAAASTPATAESPQYTTIGMLYLGVLNRAGGYSTGELQFYRDKMIIEGQSEDQVATSMLASTEAQGYYLPADSNAAFVGKVYLRVFGRAGDSAGISYWANQIPSYGAVGRGHILISMMRALMNNPAGELQARVDFRQKLVNELAAASAQAGGANAHVAAASARANKDLVADKAAITSAAAADAYAAAAAASTTASNTSNAAATAAASAASVAASKPNPLDAQRYTQITQLYQAVLNRGETIQEANFYFNLMQSGQTLVQIAQAFLNSSEAQAYYKADRVSQTDANFVNQVYLFVFGRTADDDGKSLWVGRLTTYGESRAQVLVGIMNSLVNYPSTGYASELLRKRDFYDKITTALSALATSAQNAINSLDAYKAAVTLTSTAARNAATAYDAGAASAVASNPSAKARLLTTRLYMLLFNHGPSLAKLNEYATKIQSGMTALQVTTELLASAEGLTVYPTSQTNTAFWNKVFTTSLGRLPTNLEPTPATSKAQMVVDLADPLHATSVVGYSGIESQPMASRILLNDKVIAALTALEAAAKLAARAATDAEAVLLRPMSELMIKSGWSLSSTGAIALASVTPVIHRVFDRWGNLVQSTDALGAVTRYEYNLFNQVTHAIDAIGYGSVYTYDAAGRNVSIKDANGNINGKVYDALGNVVAEKHADGGIEHYRLNAFGERVLEREANGVLTAHTYDKLGRLASTTRAAGTLMAAYKGVLDANGDFLVRTDLDGAHALTETYEYDQLGRRVRTRSTDGIDTRVAYDARGHVIETNIEGHVNRYEYNAYGFKTKEIQAFGTADQKTLTWAAGAWGRAADSTDAAGRGTGYTYNRLGQVLTQTAGAASGTGKQYLTYSYDATSGLLTRIEDTSGTLGQKQVTQYAYDAMGNRIREKTSLQSTAAGNLQMDVLQDNHIAYDVMGRVSTIKDSRYDVAYLYDANGNRILVKTIYRTPEWRAANPVLFQEAGLTGADSKTEFHSWSAYDAMNRQIVVDGVNLGGTIGITISADAGQRIAYDSAGNRLLVRQWGKQLVSNTERLPNWEGGQTGGFTENFSVITTWGTQAGYVNETYGYDAAGRLTDTWRDGMDVQALRYDRAGRVVQSGLVGVELTPTLGTAMTAAGISPNTQINGYTALGQLVKQTLLNPDGGIKTHLENHYNQLGQLTAYEQHIRGDGGYLGEFDLTYESWDASKVKTIVGASSGKTSITTNTYDANGHLVHAEMAGENWQVTTRDLINDAAGRVLRKTEGGYSSNPDRTFAPPRHVTHTLIANGEVIGSSSDSGAAVTETFRNSFVPTNSASYTSGPQAYTVQLGDTLPSIAKALWGNADLWYLIAEANGTSEVIAGNIITIPAKPNTVYNDFDTFKPYSASDAVGDTTPILPMPQSDSGCGAVGQIIMIVVAIVVTIYTAGATAAAFAPAGSAAAATTGLSATMTLGTSVLTGGAAAAGVTTGMAVAAGAVGGAIGSIASQAVGIAIGAQDSFNWKGVALGALSAGAGAGVGALASAGTFGGGLIGQGTGAVVGRAALGSALSQGIGVVTGLQDKFSWRSVAASAVGAGVGQAVGPAIGDAFGKAFGENAGSAFAARLATGLVAGTATAVMRGGRIAVQQIATDAFGNAIGQSLASASISGPDQMTAPAEAPQVDADRAQQAIAKALAEPGNPFWDDEWPVRTDGESQKVGFRLPKGRSTADVTSRDNAGQGLSGNASLLGYRSDSDFRMEADYSIVPQDRPLRLGTQVGVGGWQIAGDAAKGVWNSVVVSTLDMASTLMRYTPQGYAAQLVHSQLGLDVEKLSPSNWLRAEYSTPYGPMTEQAADYAQLAAGGYGLLKWGGLGLKTAVASFGVAYSSPSEASPIASLIGLRKTIVPALGDGLTLERLTKDGVAIVRSGEHSYSQIALQSSTSAYRNQVAQIRELEPVAGSIQRAIQEIRAGIRFEDLPVEWRGRILAERGGPRHWLATKWEAAATGSQVDATVAGLMRQGRLPSASEYVKMPIGPDLLPRSGVGLKLEITSYTPSLNAVVTHAHRYSNETLRYILHRAPGLKP